MTGEDSQVDISCKMTLALATSTRKKHAPERYARDGREKREVNASGETGRGVCERVRHGQEARSE